MKEEIESSGIYGKRGIIEWAIFNVFGVGGQGKTWKYLNYFYLAQCLCMNGSKYLLIK